jgi:hypothetical protein
VIAAHRDLTPELAALRERRMPMLVLWGERDRVIPMTSFDVLCEAIGSEGRVVPGGHSWLLANPEAFGEVLDNLVHVESAQRVTASAAETAAALLALLHETSLPIGAVQHLVEGAAPLWLMSEPPAALATDLAMCHPPLEPAEVRAVARPAGDARTWRLTVVAHDRPGLLADTAAVLGAERLSIVSASATTWADTGLALHALSVTSAQPLDEARWASLGAALRLMSDQRPRGRFLPVGRASVTTSGGGIGRALVHITAPDQRWLLWAICSWLAANGVTIETASVATEQGEARDVFVVHGDFDPKALAERLSRMNVVDRSRAHILRPLLVPMLLPAMAVRSGLRALASRRGRRSSHL